MTNQFGNDIYCSPKTLSLLAMGFLGGVLLCNVLFVLLSIGLLTSDRKMSLVTGESVPLAFVLIGFVGVLHLLLFLASIVFFLIWEHRAFKNLSALRAQNVEFTPGWAVGWWFIPFANLLKPYQAISELWNESDPDFDPEGGFLSSAVGSPPIVGWWWAFFIISNILLSLTNMMANGGRPSEIGAAFAVVFLTATLVRSVDDFLVIKIIRNITARQELRFLNLGSLNNFGAPPPPPRFD